MSNIRRGLPLTKSRIEKIFPKLTPDQISRISTRGHIRSIQNGEVLVERGNISIPFFVVISGEIEIVTAATDSTETLVTVYDAG